MDDSIILNKNPENGSSEDPRSDDDVPISVNERLAAYESWQGNSSSSEDEEDHDEGVQDGEWEMKDNEEAYEELDDDFDEFMSAPLAPMPQQDGEIVQPPCAPVPVVHVGENYTHDEAEKEESVSVPILEPLPRDRLAPLTDEKIAKIKNTMAALNFKRTGPIENIASRLEGQRIGDEISK